MIDFRGGALACRGVRYDLLGEHFGKSFLAKKLSRSRILWLNKRWFFEQGYDISSERVLQDLEKKILNSYAAVVPPDYFPASAITDETVEFNADRYGAPAGAPAGGSGRCGYIGAWNAKGIGTTPLVGQAGTVDWYHSHGCMWIEEAIREAILSEIVSAEYPHGGVPILAIIDPYLRIHGPREEHTGERRAIVIRPNFLRLAHLERSVFFGTSGTEDSDQVADAQRIKAIVNALNAHWHGQCDIGLQAASLDETFRRLAQQAGFSWAHRFFAGSYFSSNVTLDGELVDFGNFRALPDWRQCLRAGGAYGPDLEMLGNSLTSVRFYAQKYGLARPPSLGIDQLREIARREFYSEVAACFGITKAEAAAALGESLFALMRKDALNTNLADRFDTDKWNSEWASRNFPEVRDGEASSNPIWESLRSFLSDEEIDLARQTASLWQRPRPLLDREYMVRVLTDLARSNDYESGEYPALVSAKIAEIISGSRRRWRQLSSGDRVIAHGGGEAYSFLRVRRGDNDDLVVIGSAAEGRAYVFEKLVDLRTIPTESYSIAGAKATIRFPWNRESLNFFGVEQEELKINLV